MTHRAGETGLTQAADKLRDDKDTNQTDNSLREFGKCAVVLRHVLYQDRPLSEAEFLFMDNHFQVLQMAYFWWKRKHAWPADFH